jgi:uncharacterized membrane protein YgdD (TMEM256/DUF423 family)
MKHPFVLIGIVFALTAVILGAFGAHGLEAQLSADRLESYHTGVRYQFYHAFALLILGGFAHRMPAGWVKAAGWCFSIGVVFFSCSIYLLATRDLLGISNWSFLGPITPIGGLFFIVGWLLFLIAAVKSDSHV